MLLNLSNTKDMDLVARSRDLRDTEHASMTELLQHLIEIERRRLELDMGYSSLYDYCVNYLEYSGAAAGRRIQAARCIRRYPVVLGMLERNELSLTTISQVESILTAENYKTILEKVKGAPYREVEKVACEYRAPLKLRDRVRPVCVAVKAAPTENEAGHGAARVENKMLIQFLASEELVKKFEEAKGLLSMGDPNMSFADVVEVLVDEYLERHSPQARHERRNSKKKGAATPDSRRREWKNPQNRHVPDAIRDEVFVRDEGRCAYVAPDGRRCTSTHELEIDHVNPFAANGKHDLSNLRLLCSAHNKRAAEINLGPQVMKPYWRQL